MTNLNKDIVMSGLFVGGMFGFVSGAFIVSSAMFATAALFNVVPMEIRQAEEV